MTTDKNLFPFLDGIDEQRLALQDDAHPSWISYGELKQKAAKWVEYFSVSLDQRGLIFLFTHNDIDSVAVLLGALASKNPVALFDPALSEASRTQLIDAYQPQWIVDTAVDMKPAYIAVSSEPLHENLSLLLSTSGSTGSPKLVRLTLDNIISNASAIHNILAISANDIACAHLPLHYSFGLSVLTSHLIGGASIRLTKMGFTDRAFWPAMRDIKITHLPGVPFHFQMMQKLNYRRLNLPSLKSLVQAGGFLDGEHRKNAHDYMQSNEGRFCVMYGQTEASPRMTTLTHTDFLIKPDSVGTPLADCKICILDKDEQGNGEVEFHGPNVMMGYAQTRSDLSKGDEQYGKLLTGDIGNLSDDNLLTLVGRSKRLGKIYGLRVNLDEVEIFINNIEKAAVTQKEDSLYIYIEESGDAPMDEQKSAELVNALTQIYTLPKTCYKIRMISEIPITARGKIDYLALGKME